MLFIAVVSGKSEVILRFVFKLPTDNGDCAVLRGVGLSISRNGGIVLFMPRRFSFRARGSILGLLNSNRSAGMGILDFSELYSRVSRLSNKVYKGLLSSDSGVVLVGGALAGIGSSLYIFNGCTRSFGFTGAILSALNRLGIGNVSTSSVGGTTGDTAGGSLGGGLYSVTLVCRGFSTFLNRGCVSPISELAGTCHSLRGVGCFINGAICFSSFGTFDNRRFGVVSQVFERTSSIYFTFGGSALSMRRFSVFAIIHGGVTGVGRLTRGGELIVGRPVVLGRTGCRGRGLSILRQLVTNGSIGTSLSSAMAVYTTSKVFSRTSFTTHAVEELYHRGNCHFGSFMVITHSARGCDRTIRCTYGGGSIDYCFSEHMSLGALPFSCTIGSVVSTLGFSARGVLHFRGYNFSGLYMASVSALRGCTFL